MLEPDKLASLLIQTGLAVRSHDRNAADLPIKRAAIRKLLTLLMADISEYMNEIGEKTS